MSADNDRATADEAPTVEGEGASPMPTEQPAPPEPAHHEPPRAEYADRYETPAQHDPQQHEPPNYADRYEPPREQHDPQQHEPPNYADRYEPPAQHDPQQHEPPNYADRYEPPREQHDPPNYADRYEPPREQHDPQQHEPPNYADRYEPPEQHGSDSACDDDERDTVAEQAEQVGSGRFPAEASAEYGEDDPRYETGAAPYGHADDEVDTLTKPSGTSEESGVSAEAHREALGHDGRAEAYEASFGMHAETSMRGTGSRFEYESDLDASDVSASSSTEVAQEVDFLGGGLEMGGGTSMEYDAETAMRHEVEGRVGDNAAEAAVHDEGAHVEGTALGTTFGASMDADGAGMHVGDATAHTPPAEGLMSEVAQAVGDAVDDVGDGLGAAAEGIGDAIDEMGETVSGWMTGDDDNEDDDDDDDGGSVVDMIDDWLGGFG